MGAAAADGSGPDPRGQLLRSWLIDAPEVLGVRKPRHGSLCRVGERRVRVLDRESTWPAQTDLWCWYCCHPFQGAPLPLPIKYDDRRDVFHVMGTFCSWACMKAHNLESASYMKSVIANTITLFHKRCTGQLRGVRPAPPRVALRVFGGNMSIEEFRAASGKPVEFAVLPPRMIVHEQAIQEIDLTAPVRTKRGQQPADLAAAVVSFKDVSTKNETLRLKRPKPLQNNRNLLERTMGIGSLVGDTNGLAALGVQPG